MQIIYNDIIPFKGFKAINLFGVTFVRNGCDMGYKDFNHERIHSAQMKEMLYIFFYLWYIMEWMINMALYRDLKKAYREISFEKEAYANEGNPSYLHTENILNNLNINRYENKLQKRF